MSLLLPSGLPADALRRDGEGWSIPRMQTSPTNIAAYLWSTLAAERLGSSAGAEARSRLDRTLATLAGMERTHGFFVNELDPRTGAALKVSPLDPGPIRHRLSAVDNAWLAVGADDGRQRRAVAARTRAEAAASRWTSASSTTPTTRRDPVRHPGQLHVGYRPDDRTYYGHYGMLNTEARIASYLGIARGQLPAEHYYRMFRTLPEGLAPQQQAPRGAIPRVSRGQGLRGLVRVSGRADRPELGREHVRGPDGHALRPRGCLGPEELGDQPSPLRPGPDRARLAEAGYGFWGFSPAASPRGGYGIYGVDELGTSSEGYFSYDPGPPVAAAPPHALHAAPDSLASAKRHGVVTPHASFLALRLRPARGDGQPPGPGRPVPDLLAPGIPRLGRRRRRRGRRLDPGPGPGDDHGGDRQRAGRRRHAARLQRRADREGRSAP